MAQAVPLRWLRWACLPPALLFALLLAPAALAQLPGLPAKPGTGTAATPEATTIAIGDITQRADEDEAFIKDMIRRSDISAQATLLQQELVLIQRDIEAQKERVQGKGLAGLPLANLESLERYLGYVDRELRQWQSAFQAVSRPLSADAAALAKKRKEWLDTKQATATGMVPALAGRIDNLVQAFEQAEQALSEPLTRLLALSREASALQTRVNIAAAAVAAQIASVDRLLWRRDSDNLFAALASAKPGDRIELRNFVQAIGTQSELADEFGRHSRAVHNGVLVVSVLLLPVIVLLSWRARQAVAGAPELQRYRKVLARPLSTWLLLTLTMLIVVHFLGPATRTKVLLLLAWLPIVRLQPDSVRALLGHSIYLTGPLIVLAVLSQMIASMSLPFRLLVLLSSVSMAAVLGWLWLRLRRAKTQRDSRRLRLLHSFAGAGAVAMVVAAASNLVGNVTLAAMLTEATLDSAYTGLFLMAATYAARGWLRYVFRPVVERLAAGGQHADGLLQVLARLFDLALFLVWIYFTLDAFRLTRPLQGWVQSLLALGVGFGSFSVTVGGVALFCLAVFLSFWAARTVRGVLAKDVLPRMTLPRGVANSVSTMTYYGLLLLGLMVALSAAGFQVSQLALVLGALSVGIGFGLQTVVNNFVSGLILMFERPIQPGDTVEVAGTLGTIRDIGMRATTFITFDGADVVVPNGMLLSEKLINWTLSTNTRRIELPVGVAYGSDPAAVAGLLGRVVDGTEGVQRHPPPSVLFTGFGASSLDFSVRAWATFDDHVFVRSRLALAIHAALKEAGIEIPFPQQDLHLKSVDADLLDKMRRKDT